MKVIALVLAAAFLALASAIPDPYQHRAAERELQRVLEQDAESQWTFKPRQEQRAISEAVEAQQGGTRADLPYFRPGKTIYIYGKAPASGYFNIDLIPEYNGAYSTDTIALRLTVDVDNYHVTRNAFKYDQWLYEENDGYSGILPRRFFSIVIVVQTYSYEISINGYHFATYSHHVPYTKNMQISINQDMDPIEYH